MRGFASSIGVLLLAQVVHAAPTKVVDWHFDGDLLDSSGLANNGTGAGAHSFVAGRDGQAVSLATGASVAKSVATGLPLLAADSWSVNYWLNLTSAPEDLAWIGGFGDPLRTSPNGSGRGALKYSDRFYFWGSNADLKSSATLPTDGNWHM